MATFIETYRAFGVMIKTDSVAQDEGDPAVEHLVASLTDQPNGTYSYDAALSFLLPAGKYMVFNGTIQGDAIPETAHVSAHSAILSSAAGGGIFIVDDGTIEISLTVEFPTQGGSANGTVDFGTLRWHRALEA